MKNICIIGMGYVGLTLAAHCARKNYVVTGIEIDEKKLKLLEDGEPHFHEPGLTELLKAYTGKTLFFNSVVPSGVNFDVIIITVGTPLVKGGKEPDLSLVNRAINSVRDSIQSETLIIFRSTVTVGLTRILANKLAAELGVNIRVAFCPERTAEGVALSELQLLPQVVGGINHDAAIQAKKFFEPLCEEVLLVSSLEEAELIKLFNNTYRDSIFAIANTFSAIAQYHGVDGVQAIKNANYGYPRSSIPAPGFVAGPCLEKDAYILAKTIIEPHLRDFLINIRSANEKLEEEVSFHAANTLQNTSKGKFVIFSGMAFKGRPETNDLRGSSSLKIIAGIPAELHSRLRVHDFMNSIDELPDEIAGIAIEAESLTDLDPNLVSALYILNNHPSYSSLEVQKWISAAKDSGGKIYDVWGVSKCDGVETIGSMFIAIDKNDG